MEQVPKLLAEFSFSLSPPPFPSLQLHTRNPLFAKTLGDACSKAESATALFSSSPLSRKHQTIRRSWGWTKSERAGVLIKILRAGEGGVEEVSLRGRKEIGRVGGTEALPLELLASRVSALPLLRREKLSKQETWWLAHTAAAALIHWGLKLARRRTERRRRRKVLAAWLPPAPGRRAVGRLRVA